MDIVGSLKNLVNVSKICIDNNVFRIHYRVTVLILIGCSVLVTSRQYIGDPIDCISDESIKNIMDVFCWIHSTYTVGSKDARTKKMAYKGEDEDDWENEMVEAHPGIQTLGNHKKITYQTYYQWVWIVLFFQAVCFYLPHYLWKVFEGGRIKTLVSDLLHAHVLAEDKKSEKKRLIIEYFAPNKGYHSCYAIQYFCCELLNFVNVIAQIFITDAFLGYEFSTYGLKVLKFVQMKPYYRNDPMARVFPTVTACEINRVGPSGKIVGHDALCVLPINILNEKIYIFLWFWFIILAVITGAALMFRILVQFSNRLKMYQMRRFTRSVDFDTLEILSQNYNFGDWFLICQLGRNMNSVTFGELLRDLAGNIEPDKQTLTKV